MKKFIYISLVLIGIISIGSNFITDSSKIDHKTVSASGTACKWISESGFGDGPHYVVPNATGKFALAGSDTGEAKMISISGKKSFFSVLPCSLSNEGASKDGYKIYDSSGNLYSSPSVKAGDTTSYPFVIVPTEHKAHSYYDDYVVLCSKDGVGGFIRGVIWTDYGKPVSGVSYEEYINNDIIYDVKDLFIKDKEFTVIGTHTYSDGTIDERKIYSSVSIPRDINGDGEWTFTCVCAEY